MTSAVVHRRKYVFIVQGNNQSIIEDVAVMFPCPFLFVVGILVEKTRISLNTSITRTIENMKDLYGAMIVSKSKQGI